MCNYFFKLQLKENAPNCVALSKRRRKKKAKFIIEMRTEKKNDGNHQLIKINQFNITINPIKIIFLL